MSLNKMIKDRLNEKFINAKVTGAGTLSPRNGYYLIREITFRPVGLHGEVPIAKVSWKATLDEKFYEDDDSEIALLSIRLAGSNGSKEIEYSNLIGSTVFVYDAGIIEQIVNDKPKRMLDCKYCVIVMDSSFTTIQTEVLNSFFGNNKTLSEAYDNFEKSIDIDLSESLEWEAMQSEVFDDPSLYPDEVYDAPESGEDDAPLAN